MSAKAFWLVEGRVIYTALNGRLSIEEFEKVDNHIVDLIKGASGAQVHVIVDATELEAIPPIHDLGKLRHMKNFRYGWMLTIGSSRKPAIHTTFVLLAQMFKVRHMELRTLDEALRYLYSVEPSLNEDESITSLQSRVV